MTRGDCVYISSVQSLTHMQLFVTPWTAALQVSLSSTNSWSLLKLLSIESVKPSNHVNLHHPLLLLPSILSISPSNEYLGLISFRIDWLDFLAAQGTLKSLFQHHSSKELILQHSAFFAVQLSHPYMTTGKTIGLTRLDGSLLAKLCLTF